MDRRAKSISHEELTRTGKLVAQHLKETHAKTFGNAEIAFFPDVGTRGAIDRLTASIGELSLNQLVQISDEANALLGPDGETVSTITISGGHIIFGGNPIPPDFFAIDPLNNG